MRDYCANKRHGHGGPSPHRTNQSNSFLDKVSLQDIVKILRISRQTSKPRNGSWTNPRSSYNCSRSCDMRHGVCGSSAYWPYSQLFSYIHGGVPQTPLNGATRLQQLALALAPAEAVTKLSPAPPWGASVRIPLGTSSTLDARPSSFILHSPLSLRGTSTTSMRTSTPRHEQEHFTSTSTSTNEPPITSICISPPPSLSPSPSAPFSTPSPCMPPGSHRRSHRSTHCTRSMSARARRGVTVSYAYVASLPRTHLRPFFLLPLHLLLGRLRIPSRAPAPGCPSGGGDERYTHTHTHNTKKPKNKNQIGNALIAGDIARRKGEGEGEGEGEEWGVDWLICIDASMHPFFPVFRKVSALHRFFHSTSTLRASSHPPRRARAPAYIGEDVETNNTHP
ncbi:hypothetical protein B0H13DRAFT_2460582 [Mycena leptocephala]|nr:hypothetical protein B0H13DRAFT_2460582 [Mycena leptocephala]